MDMNTSTPSFATSSSTAAASTMGSLGFTTDPEDLRESVEIGMAGSLWRRAGYALRQIGAYTKAAIEGCRRTHFPRWSQT